MTGFTKPATRPMPKAEPAAAEAADAWGSAIAAPQSLPRDQPGQGQRRRQQIDLVPEHLFAQVGIRHRAPRQQAAAHGLRRLDDAPPARGGADEPEAAARGRRQQQRQRRDHEAVRAHVGPPAAVLDGR
ncbi:MAG: hypothetical protein ACK5QX_05295, partial [bacterium]